MKIKIYSKTNCPACVTAKEKLIREGVDYEDVNIDRNAEAKAFVIGAGHRSVPVFYQDGVLVKLEDLLK